jgi:hypothetical protein
MSVMRTLLLALFLTVMTGCTSATSTALPYSPVSISASTATAQFDRLPSAIPTKPNSDLVHYRGPNPYQEFPAFEVAYDSAVWQFVEDDGSGRKAQLFQRNIPGCSMWLQAGPVGDQLLSTRNLAEREWTISLVQPAILNYATRLKDIYFIIGVTLPEKYLATVESPCQQAAEDVLQTFKVIELPTTPTPLPTRTATRRPKPTFTPTQIPPTKTQTITPTSAPMVAAPPGLIYSDGRTLWLVDVNGQPGYLTEEDAYLSPDRQWAISETGDDDDYILLNITTGYTRVVSADLPWFGSEVTWSPDSKQFYFRMNDESGVSDIWSEEVATGKRRNLTRTPDRYEGETWDVTADHVFFYSWPTDIQADGPGWRGSPTLVGLHGDRYHVMSDEFVYDDPSLSPDGQTVAYTTYDDTGHLAGWRYSLGGQSQTFQWNWQELGLQDVKTIHLSSPRWSPDGNNLLWWLWGKTGDDSTEEFQGIGLFDYATGKARFLSGFGGGFHPDIIQEEAEWSSDSKRLVFNSGVAIGRDEYGDYGNWIADLETLSVSQFFKGECYTWAWRPDGQQLAFSCYAGKPHPVIWLLIVETGELFQLDLPPGSEIRGWVNPQS